jgi:hypothetical protein
MIEAILITRRFTSTADRLAYVVPPGEIGQLFLVLEDNSTWMALKTKAGADAWTNVSDPGGTAAAAAAAAQATANAALPKAGGTMSGAIDMGGFKITTLGAPSAAGDAARKADVDAVTAAGSINALTAKATVVDADVTAIEDSAAAFARKKITALTIVTYFLSVARTFLSDLSVAGNVIVGLGDPSKHLYFFDTTYFIDVSSGLHFQSPNHFTWSNPAGAVLALLNTGKVQLRGTATAAGTTGAQTINKPCGSVNFVAASSSLVVTNSLVTATSLVFCQVQTNDATAVIKSVVCAAGSFTINMTAAVTAETRVSFLAIDAL